MSINVTLQPPHFREWLTGKFLTVDLGGLKRFLNFSAIDFVDSVFLITASVCTIIVVAIALIEIYFVSTYISSENVRHYLTWLIFMLPVSLLIKWLSRVHRLFIFKDNNFIILSWNVFSEIVNVSEYSWCLVKLCSNT